MDSARWEQVKKIFQDVRDTPEPGRAAALDAACDGDGPLRAQVEALLAADSDAGHFLASPTRGMETAASPDESSNLFERLQRAVSGRFSLEKELGRGGMGIVFLARDVALDRAVAIKVLPPQLAVDTTSRERFIREARTAAGLSHPNIVPIHHVEERDDLVYFVMALVDGESLGDRLRRTGPLKPAEAARLLQEVAWALGYAHGRGVIHRDIKPDNILIERGSGRALVTDFGIARVSTSGTVSQQGEVIGTMRYMSPEQASADAVVDGRADLYSLGVTAYLAVAGQLPYESDNPAAMLAMQVAQPAPPLKSVAKGVPSRLAEAIDRCLAKDPAARFATGEALAESIADAQVTVREIAPSVREFIQSAKSAAINLYSLGMLWWIMASLVGNVAPRGRVIGHPLDPVFFILGIASIIAVVMPVNATRKVLRAGMDERDVADALAKSQGVRDANVDYELSRIERLATQMSSAWGRAAFLLFAVFLGKTVFDDVWTGSIEGLGHLAGLLGGASATLLVASAGLAPRSAMTRLFNTLTRGTPEYAGFFGKLWSGPLGRWTFRIAGLGMKRARSPRIPDAAPTEVLLGRAAADMFKHLPADVQARLGDVPEVIRGLEHVAARMRARRDELKSIMADAGAQDGSTKRQDLAADLAAASDAVEGRLAEAVAALESLRLDLLRLRAGVGGTDGLTATIAGARQVQRAVDLELSAQHSMASLLEPGPRRVETSRAVGTVDSR